MCIRDRYQPYRRGQAWLRAGLLRARAGDAAGARTAAAALLRLWDRAPRDLPAVREAERLRDAGAAGDVRAGRLPSVRSGSSP